MSAEFDDEPMDIRELVAIVWRRRWWMVWSVGVFAALFTAAALLMKPVYTAAAVVIPAASSRTSGGALSSALGQLGGLASFAGLSVGSGDSETTEALAILRSRGFIEQFISDNRLLPVLFDKRWDAATSSWRGPPEKAPTLAKGYRFFSKNVLSVTQDKKTSLITVQVNWGDRTRAAEWANQLVARINETMRQRAIAASDSSVTYLEHELRNTNLVATQEAINRLIEAQIKQRMLANVSHEYAFRVVENASAPEADEPIKPKKLMLVLAGLLLGAVVGSVSIFVAQLFGAPRPVHP